MESDPEEPDFLIQYPEKNGCFKVYYSSKKYFGKLSEDTDLSWSIENKKNINNVLKKLSTIIKKYTSNLILGFI